MRIKKGTYLVIALLLAFFTGKAQMTVGSFTMSPIVISTATATTIGGNPVLFDSGSKCMTVVTGLRTLAISGNAKGVFGASCAETVPVGEVISVTSVSVFPNPTHSLTKLKCEGNFDANLSGQVRIISMDGRVMMSRMVPMQDIKAGYVIDASAYAAGTYVVSVDFMNQHYTTKLIKI